MMMPLRREEAGRNVDAELLRQPLHGEHRRMLIHRKGAGEMALVLGAAEIMALKQLGREDDLRALVGGFAHECGYRVDIVVDSVGEGKLERGDGSVRHSRLRHPSERWKPPGGAAPASRWIPAFPGSTAISH